MPDIHLMREHTLGLDAARRVANAWADQLRAEFSMDCRFDCGALTDMLHFSRSGVNGTLQVSASSFELDVHLGFLLGAYRDRIEHEVSGKLDELLRSAVSVQ